MNIKLLIWDETTGHQDYTAGEDGVKEQDRKEATTESMSRSSHRKTGSMKAVDATYPQTEELSHTTDFSFRTLYENTPVMMHSLGASNQLVCVNRRWLEVLGYEKSEVIGHETSEFLSEVSHRYIVEVARPKLHGTGSVRDVPYPLVKKTGM